MSRKVNVVSYNPIWPEQFESEASKIKRALGDNCIAIHHVGSTAVPGLAAKPTIDIILVVKTMKDVPSALEEIGYTFRGEFNIPLHFMFSKREGVFVNLHVYQDGHAEIELNLTFRDFLRSHPDLCEEYAEVKRHLLENKSAHEKEGKLFKGYTLGKNAFIRRVLKLGGFQRLRFVFCTHYDEWEVAKKLSKQVFFDNISDHPDHIHFILYKGVDIIGYAHIRLLPKSRAAIRSIVLEESSRNQGYGSQFLKWIELWLQSQSYRSIHTEAHPDAVSFYEHLGYVHMPFDDPDGYESDPRDTPMGRLL